MKFSIRFFLFCLPLLAVSCGGLNPLAKGPAQALVSTLMAANEGKYSEANEGLSSELKERGKRASGGTKAMWDTGTKNGTIAKIEVVKEEIRGEGATVTINIHYKDGSSTSNDENAMIKEQGAWRVAP